MQRWGKYLAAILFAVTLLHRANATPPPVEPASQPAPVPAPAEAPFTGPKRPERAMKFADRPTIPWSELRFADDEVQRMAQRFHEFADSLVAAHGTAERYKDITASNNPNYAGLWTLPDNDRRLGISLHGQTIDGVDRFHRFEAESRTQTNAWLVSASFHVWTKTSPYKTNVSVFVRPLYQPNPPDRRNPEPFYLLSRGLKVAIAEGSRHYQLSMTLPHSEDQKRNVRMLYGTPEELLQLASEDIETLRKLAKQELPMQLTVFDQHETSSAKPPMPLPVQDLKPETQANMEKAIDLRLDVELAALKADYRELHQAIQLAMPRELYDILMKPVK